jgi:hypothetical protein
MCNLSTNSTSSLLIDVAVNDQFVISINDPFIIFSFCLCTMYIKIDNAIIIMVNDTIDFVWCTYLICDYGNE